VTQTNEPAPVVPDTAPISPSAGGAAAVPAAVPGAQPGLLGTPPIGKIRNTGTCVLLSIVTLGVYTWYWYYKTHEEMKQHSGTGIGGPLALILAMFVGVAMPFVTPSEVGGLYERRGQAKPVSGSTGLWFLLLGWFFFVGAIVWFVKTNGALNAYWRSLGAQG
jgi:hypothetical protein